MVDEIIKNNNNLQLSSAMISYLRTLEQIIPIDLRDNFYRNLQDVKVVFDKEILDNKNRSGGKYDCKTNTIYLDRKFIIDDLKKAGLEEADISKTVDQVFLHEFIHMSSAYYDKENDTFIQGFEKKGEETNGGLDEGTTELLSLSIVQPRYNVFSSYTLQYIICSQLFHLIGQENYLRGYYSGTQTKLIDDGLNHLINNVDFSHDYLREIESLHILINSPYESDSLYLIQDKMLDYLKAKLATLANQDEIDLLINQFKSLLITNDNISRLCYNKDKYIKLEKNEKKFNKIINNYQKKANSFYRPRH